MPDVIASNIKSIVGGCLFLIGVGIGWSEWTTRLNQKADRVQVEALERQVARTAELVEQEKRITRILLCRMPEIRPDSNCEGFR